MLGLKSNHVINRGPVFNDIVLFQLMTDGPKGTKPLITCDDIHFVQIESKTQIIPSKNEMSILTQFSPSAHLVHI